jgi:hypothetical protein
MHMALTTLPCAAALASDGNPAIDTDDFLHSCYSFVEPVAYLNMHALDDSHPWLMTTVIALN